MQKITLEEVIKRQAELERLCVKYFKFNNILGFATIIAILLIFFAR